MTSIPRLIYLSVLFQFLYTTAYSANHYVDKNANGLNNGTSWANAWESFSAINWSSIDPGDVVYISGGTDSTIYYERLQTDQLYGTATNPIVIIAGKYAPVSTGHSGRVIIDGGGVRDQSIWIHDSKYVTVKGFECRRATSGVYIEGDNWVSNVIVDSLTVYDFLDQAGILIKGYPGTYTVDSTIVRYCSVTTPLLVDGQTDCFYLDGTQHTVIHDCYIRNLNQDPNAHNDAIQGVNNNGFLIYNNIVINDSVYSPEGGGMPFILGAEGNNPVVIYNNFIYMGGAWWPHANMGYGLMTRFYSSPTNQPPAWIINNTIVINGPRVGGIGYEYNATSINNIIAMWCPPDGWLGENWRTDTYNHGWSANFNVYGTNSMGTYPRIDSIRNNLYWKQDNWETEFEGTYTNTSGSHVGISGWSSWLNNGGTGIHADPLFVHNIGREPDQGAITGELQPNSPAINAGEDVQVLIESFGLPWADINGNPRDNTPTIGAYEYDAGPDLTPPKVTGATLLDSTTLVVNFSEALDEATAEDENNYSIINNINVFSASLSGLKVTLQTSPHSPGSYMVTVANVEDLAGNPIHPDYNTAEYILLPPDTLMMLPVVNVEGVIQEPDHTPLKTIDGLGALSGDPDSRWAAEPMPEELVFDLGSIRTVGKTRLSFYNWNAGRVYNYSISISSDNNNWITIVPEATSTSNEEWTIDEFPLVNARFVQVHFINNNQSTWAGLWEGEIWGTNTTVVDPSNNNLLNGFSLSQNYPNPFNPSTTINYSIPGSSFVSLIIYNVLGKAVATLVNEEKSGGSYEVKFSTIGGSSSGGGDIYNLPSGIYFYRLQAGSFVETKKMILLK